MDGAHLCFPLKRKEEHPHYGKCEGQWGEKKVTFMIVPWKMYLQVTQI